MSSVVHKLTETQRDLLPAAYLRKPGLRIHNLTAGRDEDWNGTSWQPVLAPGSSFTPIPYQANPLADVTSLQNWVIQHRDNSVTAGQMQPPPQFVISGQITGSVQNGITIERRDNGTNALIDSITTNAGGNYSFPARVAGVYKLTPSIAGHYFTPSQAVITLTANTAQNFLSAVASASSEVSASRVLIGSSSGIRIATKSPFALELETFPTFGATNTYGQAFASGFWFVPRYPNNDIRVYDEITKANVGTITPSGISSILRVFVLGARLLVVGSNALRFFDYNFTTHVATPLGAGVTTLPSGFLDAVFSNGKAYILHTPQTSPLRNLVIADFAMATFQNVSIDGNAAHTNIGAGNDKLCVSVNGAGVRKIIDAISLTILATSVSLSGAQQGRTSFVGGRWWLTISNQLHWIDETGTTGLASFAGGANPLPGGLHGSVADTATVYAADNGSGRLFRIDPTTATEITPSISTSGFGAAYLKN